MARCARSVEFTSLPGVAVAPGQLVRIGVDAVGFTLRAVTAAGVGVDWSLARDVGAAQLFHFTAGEAFSPGALKLDADLSLRVVSAAGSLVELVTWLA